MGADRPPQRDDQDPGHGRGTARHHALSRARASTSTSRCSSRWSGIARSSTRSSAGLERRGWPGGHSVIGIASVASFFVSRVDGKVDPQLDASAALPACAPRRDRERVRWPTRRSSSCSTRPVGESLAAQGAMVQRPLWASTSTKDPALPDVYYVEPLIAPHTVNTLPPATFAAYRDHGEARDPDPAGVNRGCPQGAGSSDRSGRSPGPGDAHSRNRGGQVVCRLIRLACSR